MRGGGWGNIAQDRITDGTSGNFLGQVGIASCSCQSDRSHDVMAHLGTFFLIIILFPCVAGRRTLVLLFVLDSIMWSKIFALCAEKKRL